MKYIILYDEVRKVIGGEDDTELILHDHGGATCPDCIKKVLDELNALHAENARLGKELEEARAELLTLIAHAVSKCADAAIIKDAAKITGATGVAAIDVLAKELTAASARVGRLRAEILFSRRYEDERPDDEMGTTSEKNKFDRDILKPLAIARAACDTHHDLDAPAGQTTGGA